MAGTTKGAKLPESRKEHMSVFCYVSGVFVDFRISIYMTIACVVLSSHGLVINITVAHLYF